MRFNEEYYEIMDDLLAFGLSDERMRLVFNQGIQHTKSKIVMLCTDKYNELQLSVERLGFNSTEAKTRMEQMEILQMIIKEVNSLT